MTEIKWGRTPHSLPRRSNSPRRNAVKTGAKTGAFRTGTLFSGIHFGMDSWGNWRLNGFTQRENYEHRSQMQLSVLQWAHFIPGGNGRTNGCLPALRIGDQTVYPQCHKSSGKQPAPKCQCRNQTRRESIWHCLVGLGSYRLYFLLDSVAWTSGYPARFHRFAAGDCRANYGRCKQENGFRFSCQWFNRVPFVRFHCSRYHGERGSSLCTWKTNQPRAGVKSRPASNVFGSRRLD